jgi:ABC-type nickel/cobalt efflux system permease component RcnA
VDLVWWRDVLLSLMAAVSSLLVALVLLVAVILLVSRFGGRRRIQ